MRFPDSPTDGQRFNYRGRIFRWIAKSEFDCNGMWVSEGASGTNDTVINQDPLWKDVVEKPDTVMDLGVESKVEGNNVSIRTRRLGESPWGLAPGELGVKESERNLYVGMTDGSALQISGSGARTWDQIEEKPDGISDLGNSNLIRCGEYQGKKLKLGA